MDFSATARASISFSLRPPAREAQSEPSRDNDARHDIASHHDDRAGCEMSTRHPL